MLQDIKAVLARSSDTMIEDAIGVLERVTLGKVVANERGVYGAIHHHMCHVNISRSQLARHALGQRANAMFGTGKRGKVRSPA